MHIYTNFPLAETVDLAFEALYGEGADDEDVEAFASRWEGLDLEHFQVALERGTGKEQVLAIFALGLTRDRDVADLIAPFLFHVPRMQRWASAFCLGMMKDLRAFPVLETLLLDGLDLQEYLRASSGERELFSELEWCQPLRPNVIFMMVPGNWTGR